MQPSLSGKRRLQPCLSKGSTPSTVQAISGASGGVGTFALQMARVLEVEVIGLCSTRIVDLVPADRCVHDIIDYTRKDFTRSGCSRRGRPFVSVPNHTDRSS